MDKIREQILNYRKRTGCSQEVLAKRVGVNPKTISEIERQEKLFMRLATIAKFERFFDLEESDEL